ncbi:CdvA-like protein [Candidatus Bathyarchaeota archaeon]|nr:CdvA-like protein [Candidatus Bathyarchaeota archaeon]
MLETKLGVKSEMKFRGRELSLKDHLTFLEGKRRSLENKKASLDRLFKSGRVPDLVYTSLDKDLSDSLSIVDEIIRKVKESIESRVLKLEEQASLLEKILSDIETAYRLNLINEEAYSKNLSSLLAGLNSTREEIRSLSGAPPAAWKKISERLKPARSKRKIKRNVKKKTVIQEEFVDEYSPEIEPGLTCKNPWNKDCRNTNIEVFIYYGDEFIPICSECWKKLAERDLNW